MSERCLKAWPSSIGRFSSIWKESPASRSGRFRIIGGGSRNRLLNQFTADATGRRVLAGPAEATALGNVAMQILATAGASSLHEVRAIIDRSFSTEIFDPLEPAAWDAQVERFLHYSESIYA